MYRIKALFVTCYMMALMIGLIIAATQVWATPQAGAWWGVVIASGVPVAFFMHLFRGKTARTSANLHWIPLAGAVGTLIALVDAGFGLASGTALLNGVLLSLLYIHWYSRFRARGSDQLGIGKLLPDLTLADSDGRTLTTKDLTQKPALWLFYRGNWCPLCMAQIKEVAAEYRRLADRGVEVFLISPQPQGHTRALAQRFEAPMRFLTDRDNRVAAQLGILARGGLPMGMQVLGYDADVPMPTVFMTAAGGRIVYSDLTDNYRIRPEPADFMAALDRAGI